MFGTIDTLHPALQDYARTLMANGFTVYAPPATDSRAMRTPHTFFHYSRTVDGRECFGTFQRPDYPSLGQSPSHSMPIRPSRLNGSSAIIGGQWGDPDTLSIDNMEPLSVEYALAVARPSNWCPFNADPTAEAVRRADGPTSVPKRFYRGARLPNSKPWGIGSHYLPIANHSDDR